MEPSRQPLLPTPAIVDAASAIAGRRLTRADFAAAVRCFHAGVDYAHPFEARYYPTRRDLLQCRDRLLPALLDPAVVPHDVALYVSLQRWLPWATTKEEPPERAHDTEERRRQHRANTGRPVLTEPVAQPSVPWPWEGGPPFGAGHDGASVGRDHREGIDLTQWAESLDLRCVTMHTSLFLRCETTAALAVLLAKDSCTHVVCSSVAASDAVSPHLLAFTRLTRFADSCWVAGAPRPQNPNDASYFAGRKPLLPTAQDLRAVVPFALPPLVSDLCVAVPPTAVSVAGPLAAHLTVLPRILTNLATTLTTLTVQSGTYDFPLQIMDEYFAALAHCKVLRKIDLMNTRFATAGSAAVATLPALAHVSVCSCAMTDDCLVSLSASPSMTYLDVSGNYEINDLQPLVRVKTLRRVVVYWGDRFRTAARDAFPKGGPVELYCVDLNWSDTDYDDTEYDGQVGEAVAE